MNNKIIMFIKRMTIEQSKVLCEINENSDIKIITKNSDHCEIYYRGKNDPKKT